jgi:hypothetical protein
LHASVANFTVNGWVSAALQADTEWDILMEDLCGAGCSGCTRTLHTPSQQQRSAQWASDREKRQPYGCSESATDHFDEQKRQCTFRPLLSHDDAMIVQP